MFSASLDECYFSISRASNKRLDRIERGHRLWHVVENQDAADADWDEDFRDEGSADIRLESADSHSTSGFGLKDLGVDLDVRIWIGCLLDTYGPMG